jgi:hypothetical protein
MVWSTASELEGLLKPNDRLNAPLAEADVKTHVNLFYSVSRKSEADSSAYLSPYETNCLNGRGDISEC